MLIAIDIGNSSISIGFFGGGGLAAHRIQTWPMQPASAYVRELRSLPQITSLEKREIRSIICSVVPGHTPVFQQALGELSGVAAEQIMVLDSRLDTGLKFDVAAPSAVGADRIANAVAAAELFGEPVIVADFGSATTITAVGRSRTFLGGAIMPGLSLMNSALADKTAQLLKVELAPPPAALGKDSSLCIRSGIFYGTAGAVERIVAEISESEGYPFRVVATGGYSGMMDSLLRMPHDTDPHLTLKGLRIIHEKAGHP